jgi:TolB-like protein
VALRRLVDWHQISKMDNKLLNINLFGACSVASAVKGVFEITGAKQKALFALLATAPFGRRTRSFLQETLWGIACYDTGRQSLRRALSDIKVTMGDTYSELISSTNSDVSLDLSRVTFVGLPKQGLFLEGLEIRETGYSQWATSIRENPSQLDALFSASRIGEVAILPLVSVLPFRAIGGDATDATIGDWLAEEMSRSLSRSRLVSVISHLSCRELAQQHCLDIKLVREQLQPDYCVVGSLRRSGANLVLDADFVDVYTGRILWTRQFAAPAISFLESAQVGMAAIVNAVGSAIADEALQHVASRAVAEIEDHRLVVAGVRLMSRLTLRELARSRELLEEAARRAPHAPEVHAWLGKWYFLIVSNGWSTNAARDTQLSLDCTARALDCAPDNVLALSIDGLAHNNLLRRLDVAQQRYDAALNINPNEAFSLLLRGTLHAFRDEPVEAVRETERARRLSPIDPFFYYYQSLSAVAYISAGRYEEALELADRSLAVNDRHLSTLRNKIVALHNLGRSDELRAAGAELAHRAPDFTISGYLRSHPAAEFEIGRKAVSALRAAGIS